VKVIYSPGTYTNDVDCLLVVNDDRTSTLTRSFAGDVLSAVTLNITDTRELLSALKRDDDVETIVYQTCTRCRAEVAQHVETLECYMCPVDDAGQPGEQLDDIALLLA